MVLQIVMKGLLLFSALVAMVSSGVKAQGYDPDAPWPCMRHDYLNTGRADETKPSELEYKDRVPMWTFHTNGPIFSTPVVGADGTVYIGSADFVFYAIGPDGGLKWSFRTERLIDSAAALSSDGRVYVPGGDGNIYALEAETGDEFWRFSAKNLKPGRVEMTDWFEGNVSLALDGLIMAPNDDFCVYGINPDGSSRFESCIGGMIWSAIPTDTQGRHFFCSLDMACYGTDARGEKLWKKSTWGIVSSSPAVGACGTVYITSFDGKVYALDPGTGKKRWAFKTRDHLYGSVALAADGTLYIGGCDGTMYALTDRDNDVEIKWAFDTLDPIRSSPVIDGDGNIYFGDGDGKVFVLSPDGRRRWSINLTETDRNDINASIALGHKAFYVAMQDGRVIQVPYDYCLRDDMASDPRCSINPGEDLPWNGEGGGEIYWMTPGGSSKPAKGVIDGILPGNVLTLRLVVREGGEAIMAGIEKNSLEVDVEPWFPHRVTVSMDHRFLNIVPEEIMDPGQEYRVHISGRYRAPGLKLLGHIWLSAGKRLGQFESEVRFRTSGLEILADLEPESLLLTSGSFYQPLIFPSIAQIGMDDLKFIVVPVKETGPNEWTAWAMLAWPGDDGIYEVAPGNRVSFPVRLKYYGDLVLMISRGSAFDHAGDRFSWSLLRISGKAVRQMESEKIFSNSFYGEGKSLSMAGSFYNVPAFGTPLTGTIHINYIDLPEEAPPGFIVRRVYQRGKKVIAEYDNQAGIVASEHHLGIMLMEKRSGEPVVLDYARATVNVTDPAGLAQRTELGLPSVFTWKIRSGLEAAVILDGVVLKIAEI